MSIWYRFDESFPSDPRLIELGLLIGDEDKALACIVRMWAWEREGTRNGVTRGEHAAAIIERAAGWKGEPGAFAAACVRVRLLVRTRSGLRSQMFAQRSGVVRESNAQAAERMRQLRAARKASKEGASQASGPVQPVPAAPEVFGERSQSVRHNVTVRNLSLIHI